MFKSLEVERREAEDAAKALQEQVEALKAAQKDAKATIHDVRSQSHESARLRSRGQQATTIGPNRLRTV